LVGGRRGVAQINKWLQRVHIPQLLPILKVTTMCIVNKPKINPINLQNLVSFKRCRCALHSNFQIPKFGGGMISVLFWQLVVCNKVKVLVHFCPLMYH
jgi:hypothetical protein